MYYILLNSYDFHNKCMLYAMVWTVDLDLAW